jgi:hypothetical protein
MGYVFFFLLFWGFSMQSNVLLPKACLKKRLFSFVFVGLLSSTVSSQITYGAELIKNGDFESGNVQGWTVRSLTAKVDFYGNPKHPAGPSFQVSLKMAGPPGWGGKSGGNYYLRSSNLSQGFSLAKNSADVDAGKLSVVLRGYFGGYSNYTGSPSYQVVFTDAMNRQLKVYSIGQDTVGSNRQFKANLLLREKTFPIPKTARTMKVQILANDSGYFADNLSCKVIFQPSPTPLPLDKNLVVNGSFETKELNGQPWEGWLLSGRVGVGLYGAKDYAPYSYLSRMRKAKVNLGNYLCRTDYPIMQEFDCRGNKKNIDMGMMELGVFCRSIGQIRKNGGGLLTIRFLNSLGAIIRIEKKEGWKFFQSGYRNILLPLDWKVLVPPFTRKIQLLFDPNSSRILLDDVRMVLRGKTAPPQVPLGVNLLKTSDFEGSDWQDYTGKTMSGQWVQADPNNARIPLLGEYGKTGSLVTYPTLAHSKTILGGKQFLLNELDKGWNLDASSTETFINIEGLQVLTDNGFLKVQLEGYFGSAGTNDCRGYLKIEFFDQLARKIGGFSTVPVTPLDRQKKNILIFREKRGSVPIGTRGLLVAWASKTVFYQRHISYADNLKVLLFDARKGRFKYPGSGKDLTLFSGIDRDPTGGAGFDVKKTKGGKVLNLRLKSIGGTFNGEVILLLGQFFPTGKPPKPLFPPLAVGLGFGFIINGYSFGGPIGPLRLLAKGSDFSFLLPPIKANMSLMLQGGVFTAQSSLPIPIVMTNGHEIQFQ